MKPESNNKRPSRCLSRLVLHCVWCGKDKRKMSDWEQQNVITGKWCAVCIPCANRRLKNPYNAFLNLRKISLQNSAMTRNDKGRGKRPEVLQANKERATPHTLRQFRYIYFLKRQFRARLKLAVKPFPKHASEGSMESRLVTNEEGQGQILRDAPISPENSELSQPKPE